MKTVTVITRTKNRPLLLHRAARSVALQKFRDFEWVVVNDGGHVERTEADLEPARREYDDLRTVNVDTSGGMEAASCQSMIPWQ